MVSKLHLLVTGDFWHADFQPIWESIDAAITFVPIENLSSFDFESQMFDLVVLAASRCDQFEPAMVEAVTDCPANAYVALLGSWCEGEMRTGRPFPGWHRVYWHQWTGQYQQFVECCHQGSISQWGLPRTSNAADRVESIGAFENKTDSLPAISVGVSAWSDAGFEMLADAMEALGCQTCWLEQSIWKGDNLPAMSMVIVEADTFNDEVAKRIRWLRKTLSQQMKDMPVLLLLNFPRRSDLSAINDAGVYRVVSKPFQLNDLRTAIEEGVQALS